MPHIKNAALFLYINYLIVSFLFHISYGKYLSFFPDAGQYSCDRGICEEVSDCPSALISIGKRGKHDLERCGWNGLIEKVCCLDFESSNRQSSTENNGVWNEISSTTFASVSTTKSNEPRGTIRKSEEVCAQYAANVPFAVDIHILGGEAAEVGEFPHMVALGYPDGNGGGELEWICGGSLISERYVLTAAHCVLRRKPVRALIGVLNITERSETRREVNIENIVLHPQYSRRNGSNDIALLRIELIQFGRNIYPACLYQRSDDPLGLIITGWGKLYLGQDIRSDVLQKARVAPVPLSTCNETYISSINRILTSSQICAGPADPMNPTDSCPGDSGAPMQILSPDNMYAVVGVVSFGLTDCGGAAPSVYTRVYQYLDWIESIVW